MKTKKLILVVAMLLSVANTWAQSGNCGDNLTWSLSDSTLTISGSGAMDDYGFDNYPPWSSYLSSIAVVIIGDEVTTIGNRAFYVPVYTTSSIPYSCLTTVTIGNGVKTIGDEAFYGCYALTAITLPDSVKTIGDEAFTGCSALSVVTIGSSVTTIGNKTFADCFAGCSGLTSINVADNNTTYSSENGILFNKSKKTLIQYPFGRKDVAYIIPNSVTTIGDWAFYYCFNLSTVTIPNSVTTIEKRAFAGCFGLTSINVDDNNPHYLSEN